MNLKADPTWKPFERTTTNLSRRPYEFFLIRRCGLHPATGKEFIPTVVQFIDGKLYTSDNELDPIIFSHKDDNWQPCCDPFLCDLEWCDIPK